MTNQNIPEIIYHYCSVETFMKIIESKVFWLSNSLKMNDYHETSWINHIVESKLGKLDRNLFNGYIDGFIKNYKLNNTVPYLACFSKDGDVLSQWRAYSDDGTGVAIGFSTKALNLDYQLPVTGATTKLTIGLHEVIYDSTIQTKIVNNIIDDWTDKLKRKHIDEPSAIIASVGSIKMYSTIFKNPSFSEEKEWRIIHTPLIMSDEDKNIDMLSNISDIGFRSSNKDIVSYFKFDLSCNFGSDLISKIMIGPKCRLDQYDFGIYLSRNKLSRTITERSMASYR